ncbi:MAG TPA: VIT domain-containing protein, partial [Thermoanaerobaculia bacterium]|nr:VIT domain-containing protein [Thermoanaerobaculia bacterium]
MSRTAVLPGLLVLVAVGLTAVFAVETPSPGASSALGAAGFQAARVAPASFRFAKAQPDPQEAEAAAPIQLTASDGTGLSLVALEANGLLEPPLAFTELRLTFENPRDQVIEGRFRIALPPGAALSRFAMKIDGAWQEGEVVERQRARQTYEEFLHRRQDPALLEQEAGNEFSARVFPIPARGRKELIVSYSQALPRSGDPYLLPLLGLPEIGELDVRVLL